MALIDPSRALQSPLLAQTFAVIRREQAINDVGQPYVVRHTLLKGLVGVIAKPNAARLQREDSYQIQSNTISISTKARLYGAQHDAAGQLYQPDIVLWRGDYYIVTTIEDWSHFGLGFVNVTAESINHIDEQALELVQEQPRIPPLPQPSAATPFVSADLVEQAGAADQPGAAATAHASLSEQANAKDEI